MKFYDFLINTGHPIRKDLSIAFYGWLKSYLEDRRKIRIIRQYSKENRAVIRNSTIIPFVAGDNEPPVWCFSKLCKNEDLSKIAHDRFISQICISDPRGKKESNEPERYNFKQVKKAWGNDYVLKHIFDVKTKSLSRPYSEMTDEMTEKQMLRNLCPMNHFLFPKAEGNFAENGDDYQAVAAYFMSQRYAELWSEYFEKIKCGEEDVELLRRGKEKYDKILLPELPKLISCLNTAPDRGDGFIYLKDKTRLSFIKSEITHLSDEQIIRFRIKNEGTGTDPRAIDIIFQCAIRDVKNFFKWNTDKDWNENGRHSQSPFPAHKERFIICGNLGGKIFPVK